MVKEGNMTSIRRRVYLFTTIICLLPFAFICGVGTAYIQGAMNRIGYIFSCSVYCYSITSILIGNFIEKTVIELNEYEIIETNRILERFFVVISLTLFIALAIMPIFEEPTMLNFTFPLMIVFQLYLFNNRNRLVIGESYALVSNRFLYTSEILGFSSESNNNKAIHVNIIAADNKKYFFLLYAEQVNKLEAMGIKKIVA